MGTFDYGTESNGAAHVQDVPPGTSARRNTRKNKTTAIVRRTRLALWSSFGARRSLWKHECCVAFSR
jgi:hypothetical protein